jgi:hypothetical protein
VKSGSFNLLETSGPVQICTGITLPLLNTEVRMKKKYVDVRNELGVIVILVLTAVSV